MPFLPSNQPYQSTEGTQNLSIFYINHAATSRDNLLIQICTVFQSSNFIGWWADGQDVSARQISSKSVNPLQKYRDFFYFSRRQPSAI